jgi:hypothetical protein
VGLVSSNALAQGGERPTVVFDVRDADDHPVPDPLVAVDGQALAAGAAASPIPTDPGTHRFTFEAPALEPQTVELDLHEGEHLRERVVLAARGRPQGEPPGHGDVQRIVGGSLLAAGLAVAALAVTVGIGAKNTYDSTLSTSCGHAVGAVNPSTCSASGAGQIRFARTQAETATGLLIAAPILVIGGALVFFTVPDARATGGRGAAGSVGALNIRGEW